jgi:hypothetical protein
LEDGGVFGIDGDDLRTGVFRQGHEVFTRHYKGLLVGQSETFSAPQDLN